MEELLLNGFAALGLPLSPESLQQYRTYYTMLEETNKVMNLTAITGETDTAQLHFLDCAALLTAENLKGKSLVDVGTGAGFPGMVLKIGEPSLQLTLMDSLGKRIHFLEQVTETLGLEQVTTVISRAEEAPEELRESFDFATARAVTRLNLLAELCLPLVKVGGAFLSMKGPEPEEEIQEAAGAIRTLGGEVEAVLPYTIPGTDVVHTVVKIRKVSPTPKKYPRRWAKMQKEPLR
ncbi:MAG: 16S rRNA (guanine(527)-N(7))-methyltransferase RsmG [Oscillospiraceae bacterium]|nr:16S rRNA (guanine(527)-N(7))-methyltransferase RsmG [Oscillospiraceae bacterium]